MKYKMSLSAAHYAGAAIALFVVIASALAAAPPAESAQQRTYKNTADAQPMKMGMKDMSNMPMSADPDKNFAMMMKMHHQKGIEMAQKELTNGQSSEMKAIAKKIIAAQTQEISDFEQWLAKRK